MKYLLLVSHGDFSSGLKQTLGMFAGDDAIGSVIAVGLKPDEAASTFGTRFEALLKTLPEMIHGLITVRWGKEYPMDGIIAVNDKAANNPILKEAYMAASDKKTFVWTLDHFDKVKDKVLNSATKYFLITKSPQDMKKILVDMNFKPGDIKTVVVGPGNDRDNAVKLGDNQSFTQEEGDAFEAIEKAGYKVEFALLPDQRIGSWDKFKSRFGY